MPFNSIAFVIFFLITISLYFFLKSKYKWQNILLLVASYVFYAYWDWRFLGLLILSTIIYFYICKAIQQTEDLRRRKIWLALSIIYGLLVLGLFKYFNFFQDSLFHLLGFLGLKVDLVILKIILPLGLSYYTFQSLSYPLDVYRRRLQPTKNILNFALFTSFFATIVSGPIERASHLLPQIEAPRIIDINKINIGLFLVVWGLFQKLVIANNAGLIADQIFNNYTQYHGLEIVAGILAFTIQIFCDFSGYTDIARGVSQLLGFDLLLNFRAPYFAKNPSDFWGRWHISLSSWLRDYLYISLGGNRKGRLQTYWNLLFTMTIVGLWHGASWTYIIWGFYHGTLLCIYRVSDIGQRDQFDHKHPVSIALNITQIILMFILVSAGWAIFRSNSVSEMVYIFGNINLSMTNTTGELFSKIAFYTGLTVIILILQNINPNYSFITRINPWLRSIIFGTIIVTILLFVLAGGGTNGPFIYSVY